MTPSPQSRPLLYTDTHRSADALYFGGVEMHDPFISFGLRGRKFAVVSALEFGRVLRTSDFDRVLPLEPWLRRARKERPRAKAGAAEVIALLARKYGSRRFTVSSDFPAGLYLKLRKLGIRLDVAGEGLFPEREIKSAAEAAAIREGNRCSALGIAAAERVLKGSRIRGGLLHYRGSVLTSERLKIAIETACLAAGAVSAGTIAAGGNQACDPHDQGSGPLRANSLIILDVFPRVSRTGYHGDMTRTYLRGRASDAQRKLVAAVREAQLAALATIRAGVNGRTVHGNVLKIFEGHGYRTKRTPKGAVGFFHSTGHGLGLEVHEAPRVSGSFDYNLREGTVVTVEPGLYYPGLGGCRIEDVVQVTRRAPRMLSAYSYNWELR